MVQSLQEQLKTYQPDPESFLRGDVHTFPVNEYLHRKEIIHDVKRDYATLPRVRDHARVHLGFAGFFNFDVAAIGRHDGMVLCDVNYDQIRFWNQVIKLLAECKSPGEFRRAFAAQYEKVKHKDGSRADHYFHVGDGGERVLLRFGSSDRMISFSANTFLSDAQWIKKPELYKHLHEMAAAGNIAAVPLDAFSEEQCTALGEAISSAKINGKDARLDSVYGSNIYDEAMPQIDYGTLLFHWVEFVKIAKDFQKQGMDVRHGRIEYPSEAFSTLRNRFEQRLGTSTRAPKNMHEKAALRDNMVAITEAFLEVYQELGPLTLMRVSNYRTAGVEREDRAGNIHADVMRMLMNRLLSHPNIDQDFIGKRYQTTPQHYYESQRDQKPEYSVLRNLATDADTKFYCASIYHRPLIKFEGPDSPKDVREWRDRMAEEGQDFVDKAAGL